MRALLVCVCLGIAACGGQPTPGSKTAASTPNEGTAGDGTPPAAESPPAPAGEFHAEVIEVRDVGESAPYKSVKMRFKNGTAKPCEVTQYELTWPGGRKLVNGERSTSFESFIVPAGESRQRSLRVHPSDGQTSSLAVAGAKLNAECN
jgi:hypothetical protein